MATIIQMQGGHTTLVASPTLTELGHLIASAREQGHEFVYVGEDSDRLADSGNRLAIDPRAVVALVAT